MYSNEEEKGYFGAKSDDFGLLEEQIISPVPGDRSESFESLITFGIGLRSMIHVPDVTLWANQDLAYKNYLALLINSEMFLF